MSTVSTISTEPKLKREPVRIAFLCLAQNCASTLHSFISYIRQLNEAGFQCLTVIGENGSSDATREILRMAEGPDFYLVDTSIMAEQDNRLARMAAGRELLLEFAQTLIAHTDYVCVADLDNVMAVPPEPEAVSAALLRLATDKSIFAVGATSRPVYYDLFSLKSDSYYNPDLPQQIAASKRNPITYFNIHQKHIYHFQYAITGLEPMICASSFNGFCLYRTKEYLQGTYRNSRESSICEHLTFNLSMGRITGKKMAVLPELVLRTPEDHEPVGLVRFWFRKIQIGFRRYINRAVN